MNELHLTPNVGADYDKVLREHEGIDQLAVSLADGVYYSAGTRQWLETPDRGFRMGRNWTFDLAPGAIVRWDVDAIPDEEIDDVPQHLFLSTEARFHPDFDRMAPQDIWDMMPRGQAVRGGTIDLQFDKAVKRWRAANKKLSIGAVLASGHQASIETHVTNYGAWGCENFPLVITGGIGQPDRDAIAKLEQATHVFDDGLSDAECSRIINSPADGYVPEASNDQVTVRMIVGNMGERNPGEWRQHFRRFAYQSGNSTTATGKNLVQAHTNYQCLRSVIEKNVAKGVSFAVYGDFYSSRATTVRLNDFDCINSGVAFFLSPTGPGNEQYSHEDHVIDGSNRIVSGGPNVRLDTLGPSTPTRYIRKVSVDAGLSLEATGVETLTRPGIKPPPRTSHCPW